jgi:large subunit ribosomal protein L7Ae
MPPKQAGKPKASPKAAPKANPKAAPKAAAKAAAKGKAGAAKKPAKPPQGKNPLLEKKPNNYGIGTGIRRGADLTRYVRWPKYIRLQRQKRLLLTRTRVPPTINQFVHTLDKNAASQLFRLMDKHRPETKQQKKERLVATAKAAAEGKPIDKSKKPNHVKFGINHVTTLVEQKKASLVVIAHDVDPVELVLWLPTLCRKKEVPYCIVKSKARLGKVVHKKTATCLAFTTVNNEDKNELATIAKLCKETFNDNDSIRRRWGGLKFGVKARHVQAVRQRKLKHEELKRAKMV